MSTKKTTDKMNAATLLEDAPLDDPQQDLLGRSSFCRELAQAILQMDAQRGFVFGLCGPWGSGKTTVLNFILHYIDEMASEATDGKPIVVRFNPWWFSGQEQLLLKFFGQMRTAIGRQDPTRNLESVGKRLQLLADALGPLAYVPVTRDLLAPLRDILSHAGATMQRAAKHAQADVVGIKDEIDRALRGQPRRIVVVIDDVDRLTAEEIRLMFGVVKSVADFPQTIYVLAYDRSVVCRALDSLQPLSGDEYLKKIVQMTYDLPLPEKSALRQMLFKYLDGMLTDTPTEMWNQREWKAVYGEGIDHFLGNARDVKRLINSIRTWYSAVRGEVSFADFVAIEALRLFVPDLYAIVRANPALYAGAFDTVRGTAGDADRSVFEQHLEQATSTETRQPAHSILIHLFPRYSAAFGGSRVGSEWEPEWLKRGRICSPAVFPVFFQLSVPEDVVSAAEMRSLIALAADDVALSAELVRLSGTRDRYGTFSRVREVLERLGDYACDDIPDSNLESTLHALFDAGNAILGADGPLDPLQMDNEMLISRVVNRILRRFPDQATRANILRSVVAQAESVPMVVHLVVNLGSQHGKYGYSNKVPEAGCIVNAEQLQDIESIALERIVNAASAGSLVDAPDLNIVLAMWAELAGSEEPAKRFVGNLVKSDTGAARYLECYLSVALVSDERHLRMHMPNVEKWVDLDVLRQRAESIVRAQPEWLTDRQKTALEVFLRELVEAPKGRDAFDRPIKEPQ